ncbi:hypothetical protein AK812_SmicGene24405 [Symbiodinium microadriaticum]|uniref:Uncharacterized protein n=1 Tax=Symbiodinium microadriaticum TaxID=2951 RepID=A0A1Q9DEN1_SYMMI|nr:hypothetical protein AK812_SmicGene24405 [Symbiodinium microadriaticum]
MQEEMEEVFLEENDEEGQDPSLAEAAEAEVATEDPADPQEEAEEAQAVEEGMILVPKAKKMPMVTIPSPKTQVLNMCEVVHWQTVGQGGSSSSRGPDKGKGSGKGGYQSFWWQE